MSNEILRYTQLEYRAPSDLRVAFAKDKRSNTGVEFQRVRGPLIKYVAKKIDATDEPIYETKMQKMLVALAMSTAVSLIGMAWAGREIQEHLKDAELSLLEKIMVTAPSVFAMATAGTFIKRDIINDRYSRSLLHPSRKLSLEPLALSNIDIESDIDFCLKHLYHLGEFRSTHLDNPDHEQLASGIWSWMDKVYGFHTEGTKRPKLSRNSQSLSRRHIRAFTTSYGEVVATDLGDLHTITHELFHTQGVRVEEEAEFCAIAFLTSSENNSLKFAGFAEWLKILIRQKTETYDHERKLSSKNTSARDYLADRCPDHQLLDKLFPAESDVLSGKNDADEYSVESFVLKIDERLVCIADKLFSGYGTKTRRKNINRFREDYISGPLTLMHAYRNKYLSNQIDDGDSVV
jgi:hypothetical protein